MFSFNAFSWQVFVAFNLLLHTEMPIFNIVDEVFFVFFFFYFKKNYIYTVIHICIYSSITLMPYGELKR